MHGEGTPTRIGRFFSGMATDVEPIIPGYQQVIDR
jgi:hypothetical protein